MKYECLRWLSPEERELLGIELLSSLESSELQAEVDAAWAEEILQGPVIAGTAGAGRLRNCRTSPPTIGREKCIVIIRILPEAEQELYQAALILPVGIFQSDRQFVSSRLVGPTNDRAASPMRLASSGCRNNSRTVSRN